MDFCGVMSGRIDEAVKSDLVMDEEGSVIGLREGSEKGLETELRDLRCGRRDLRECGERLRDVVSAKDAIVVGVWKSLKVTEDGVGVKLAKEEEVPIADDASYDFLFTSSISALLHFEMMKS